MGEPYFERMGAPIGIALLFLMAVGPLLPWRATSGELLRRPLADPGVGGRHHARRRRRARRDGRRAGARRSHWPPSRSRASGARSRSECGPAAARIGEAIAVAARAHGARQPAVVRRAARARRCRRRSPSRSPRRRATRRGAKSNSRPASRRRCAATPSRTSAPRSNGATRRRASRRASRLARVATTSACTRRRSRPIPNFWSGIGTPSVRTGLVQDVYLTLISSPTATR